MIFGLAVEILQTLVSMVLNIHGLGYYPGHWVRVLAKDLDLVAGWSPIMVLLLVVPDEALFLHVELVFPVLFSSCKNIFTRLPVVTAAALLPISWFAGRQLAAVLIVYVVFSTDATASLLIKYGAFRVATITRLCHIAAH